VSINSKFRSGCLTMLAALIVFSFSLPAMAQGCALCYTQAASAGARMIQALRSGILILVIPPTLGTVGLFFVVHRRSHQYRMEDEAGPSGQEWQDGR